VKLGGHYQSYKYFDHNKDYIHQLFSPSNNITDILYKKYGKDVSKVTAVQVRRGDYYKFPNHHPLLTPEYYSKAVKLANPEEIWIFSDDIEWCQKNLNFDGSVRYIEDEDYIELYLMTLCKNVIISNSSFGWWAAYLNTNSNVQIYAPSPWFGPAIINDGFKLEDLIPKEWNTIEL
jgi:hypothetical protein